MYVLIIIKFFYSGGPLQNLPGTPTPDPGFPDDQVGFYLDYIKRNIIHILHSGLSVELNKFHV